MTRNDEERPEPDAEIGPPARSEATETTGTWAFISPFAAAPGSYLAPVEPVEPVEPAGMRPDPVGQPGMVDRPPPAGPERPEAPSWADPGGSTALPPGDGQPHPWAAPPGSTAAPTTDFGRPEWGSAHQPGWQNAATGAVGGGSWAPEAPLGPPSSAGAHGAPDVAASWGAPAGAGQPPTWGAPAAPDPDKPPSRWKTWQKVTAGGVLAGVVAIGGVAAVSAANASSNSDTTQAGFSGGPGAGGGETGRFDGGGMRGGSAGAMALANALHGDFVVSSGSGTQTMRLQTGELTAVAADSITVKSADGYTSTYAIGSGVDVSGLTQGATVRVLATVAGDTASATAVTSGSTGGFGGAAGAGESGSGRGGSGLEPPEGMQPPDGMERPPGLTPPTGADQAPPTS
ncbi:hypothetical protein [Nakamurella sp.]|uniref:hypothetical protein n=1 Tax=Nakamurella sp. TaxID=1869182 RepID=UPI0037851679